MEYYGTGYIQDTIDARDKIYEYKLGITETKNYVLDKAVDLRNECMPKVYSQGSSNSCTAQSIIASLEYQLNRVTRNLTDNPSSVFFYDNLLSRKFLYAVTRGYEGNITIDSGASLKNSCKSIQKFGVVNNTIFPETNATTVKPTFENMIKAGDIKANAYYRITTIQGIIDALDRDLPVIIGTDISMFNDVDVNGLSRKALTWSVKSTTPNHAMLIAGKMPNFNYYGTICDVFLIRNSHSENWGQKGYIYLPIQKLFDYNLFDIWVVIRDSYQIETENIDYLNKTDRLIPNGSIVIGNKAYDLNYANNPNNSAEIQNALNYELGERYIKDLNGKWTDLIGNSVSALKITFPIYYKDENGVSRKID